MMISVIIPTLNEQHSIGALIQQLISQKNIELEIIVVDGGSEDGTVDVIEASGLKGFTSPAGRGAQMNEGARRAHGEHLLFLHADSQFTDEQQLGTALTHFLREDGLVAGHFPLKFHSTKPSLNLQFFESKASLNRPETFNGDQGLLIRRREFELTGGFSEQYRFLEDQEFAQRFRSRGRFITLPYTLITSARRFEEEGVQQRILLNTIIMAMFHLRLGQFFDESPGVYKKSVRETRLVLLPFFNLAANCVSKQGLITALARYYALGRYTTRNLWQLFLWRGLKTGDTKGSLAFYDRYIRRLFNNPLGYLLGTFIVFTGFNFIRLRLYLTDR
jgi:rSAM/selenodomain-associated transferase 2